MLFSWTSLRDRGSGAAAERTLLAALALLACLISTGPAMAYAVSNAVEESIAPPPIAAAGRLAQAQPQPLPAAAPAKPAAPPAASSTPASSTPASPAPTPDTQATDEPIGNVATLTGTASVVRKQNTLPLKLKDDIYLNDVVVTFADSSVGITFNDETTFNLNAKSSITIDNFVYEDGGRQNSALFDVTKGTVAFVAAAVAKTGNMKIATPTATLGIRGTTGLVEVSGGPSGAHNIKLYPDPDGHVGSIDVADRTSGARLGSLTQGSSGFTLRAGAGGRITAAPLVISPQQAARDQGIVRQVHAAQSVGRQVVSEQRALRRANPNRVNPNAPRNLPNAPRNQPNAPRNPPGQPGQRQNNLQQRPNGPQQGQPNRAGQPRKPGEREVPNRAGENSPGGRPTTPNRAGETRPGQPGQPNRAGETRPAQPAAPNRATEEKQRQRPPAAERPNAPALRQGGLPNRPAAPARRPPPPPKKPPKEKRR